MRIVNIRHYVSLLILTLGAFAMVGCQRDEVLYTEDMGRVTVVFTSEMTGAQRALTQFNETNIQRLDVLVFTSQDDGEEVLHRMTVATGVLQQNNRTSFSVMLSPSRVGEQYRLVFLANLDSDHIPNLGLQAGESKDVVLSKVTFAPPTVWGGDAGGATTIPMSCESELLRVSSNQGGATVEGLIFERSLARVNIYNRNNDLKLRGVYVYNHSPMATVSPTSTTVNGINRPDPFYVAADETTNSIEQSIYIAEQEPLVTSDNVSFVIEVIHTQKMIQPRFYHLKIYDRTTNEPSAVVRNRNYNLSIEHLFGNGHPSPVEALMDDPVNRP